MVNQRSENQITDITFKRVNRNWSRCYFIIDGESIFIGAERPEYLYKQLLAFYNIWPREIKWILSLSETHTSIYGKAIDEEYANIQIQDKDAKIIYDKVILHKCLINAVDKIKK